MVAPQEGTAATLGARTITITAENDQKGGLSQRRDHTRARPALEQDGASRKATA